MIRIKNNKTKKKPNNKQNNNKKTKTTWWIVRRTTITRHNNKNKGNSSTCPVQICQTILCSFTHPVSMVSFWICTPPTSNLWCDSANLSPHAVPIQLHQHGPTCQRCQDTRVRSPPICNCGRIFWTKEPFAESGRLKTHLTHGNFPHSKMGTGDYWYIQSWIQLDILFCMNAFTKLGTMMLQYLMSCFLRWYPDFCQALGKIKACKPGWPTVLFQVHVTQIWPKEIEASQNQHHVS